MTEIEAAPTHGHELTELTARVVSAYVRQNKLSQTDLPILIGSVFGAFTTLQTRAEPVQQLKPAVPIRKSITPDYLISLEDGKKFKSLKRYLRVSHNMSPDEYRAKWGLPPDYPMVAPNYSAARSAMAKNIGLGRKPAEAPAPPKRARARAAKPE